MDIRYGRSFFNKKQLKNNKGFTLIEILLVVAAIAILAGIVIISINPGKQLGEARNAQRRADVNTILNAVYQYTIDNNGVLPSVITTSSEQICKTDISCSNYLDLSVLTNSEKYLITIPVDPLDLAEDGTGYTIYKTANGRIVVEAPFAEQGAEISVRR